jgi:hypothetical protein
MGEQEGPRFVQFVKNGLINIFAILHVFKLLHLEVYIVFK